MRFTWKNRITDIKATGFYHPYRCGKCQKIIPLNKPTGYCADPEAPAWRITFQGSIRGSAWVDRHCCEKCTKELTKGKTFNVFGMQV